MNPASLSNVLVFSVLGVAGVAGGAAITAKLVDNDAGLAFLGFGSASLAAGFLCLLLLRQFSRRSAIAYLLFIALGINVGGTSMMLGVAMPLFCLHGYSSLIGGVLLGYFFGMLIYQLWKSYRDFVACWEKHQGEMLSELYSQRSGTIRVERLLTTLHIQAQLFLPVRSELLHGAVSLGLIVLMIIGLNLRRVYPEFSAFAWGVPALTLTTVLLQMSFLRILLAARIRKLEISSGNTISPLMER